MSSCAMKRKLCETHDEGAFRAKMRHGKRTTTVTRTVTVTDCGNNNNKYGDYKQCQL